MVDYAAWVEVDPLPVEAAAQLWAGLDPLKLLYFEESARLAPKLLMLFGAITRGVLRADHRKNSLLASSGRYERSEVTRDDLKAYARSIGERPVFLFYDEPLPQPKAGPRSISNAPPPVTTLRGSVNWSAARAAPAQAPPATLEKAPGPAVRPARSKEVPPARRGAAVPITEDDIVADMLRASEQGAPFSVRAYVLQHDKEISGPNPNAKIRRLQRKFDRATKPTPA